MDTKPVSLPPKRGSCGFSLVEAMVVVAVIAVVATTAVPSLVAFIDGRRLDATATALAADVQFVRTEAVARNQPIRISFHDAPGGTCWVVHTGPAAQCSCNDTPPAVCGGGAVEIKTVVLGAAAGRASPARRPGAAALRGGPARRPRARSVARLVLARGGLRRQRLCRDRRRRVDDRRRFEPPGQHRLPDRPEHRRRCLRRCQRDDGRGRMGRPRGCHAADRPRQRDRPQRPDLVGGARGRRRSRHPARRPRSFALRAGDGALARRRPQRAETHDLGKHGDRPP